eukprot:TRINITY_DN37008_c0_g1_i1.p1 TRINITY_DN37008_c0_g1~~TRINITY_DN37008_c0_g1_i1.p1  ORF type:complete len:313 (-),score=88.96 TRINITY_DN37008_c0_g1_i1:15-953(-)
MSLQAGYAAVAAFSAGEASLPAVNTLAELEAFEESMTSRVPTLLEAMNHASDEVNSLDRQAGEAEQRHQQQLDGLSVLQEGLFARFGEQAVNRARPFFKASQDFEEAAQKAQAALRDFSASSSGLAQAKLDLARIEEGFTQVGHGSLDQRQQDSLAYATERVLQAQACCDAQSARHAGAVSQLHRAETLLSAQRKRLAGPLLRHMAAACRQLQQHAAGLKAERLRMDALGVRARAAKETYRRSLGELDRISTEVHKARQAYLDSQRRRQQEQAVFGLSEEEPASSRPPELCPEPGEDPAEESKQHDAGNPFL